jgi:hypothetical protein
MENFCSVQACRVKTLESRDRDRMVVAFNNISVISWLSVLLADETGVPGENLRPAGNHWQTLSHVLLKLTFYDKTDCKEKNIMIWCSLVYIMTSWVLTLVSFDYPNPSNVKGVHVYGIEWCIPIYSIYSKWTWEFPWPTWTPLTLDGFG